MPELVTDKWDIVLVVLIIFAVLWKVNAPIMEANILHEKFIFDCPFGLGSPDGGYQTLDTLRENAPPSILRYLGVFYMITDLSEWIIGGGFLALLLGKLYERTGWMKKDGK